MVEIARTIGYSEKEVWTQCENRHQSQKVLKEKSKLGRNRGGMSYTVFLLHS